MSGGHYLDDVIAKLRALNDAGFKQVSNGTLLIGKLPPRPNGMGSHAYLHEFYAPISVEQIGTLERKIRRPVPEDVKNLLQHANGLSLFFSSLSIAGLRFDYSRQMSDEARQPVSMEYGNVIGRPLEGEEGNERFADNSQEIRFGGFCEEPGSELMMKIDGDRRVYAVPRDRMGPVLYEWPDLPTLLMSEVARMSELYRTTHSDVGMLKAMPPPWQT